VAGRGGRNELSGEARFAAQVRTVHGGLHMSGSTMMGVALVFAIVGLVLVTVIKRPETVSVPGMPAPEMRGDSAVAKAVEPALGAVWDVIEVPKGAKPPVVAVLEAEEFLRREWPENARLRDARSSRISGGLWFRADVVLPGGACTGVIEVVVIDLGEVYSVLVITAVR
jgi:hypothetical protein